MIHTEPQTSYNTFDELHDLFDLDVRVSIPETSDGHSEAASRQDCAPCTVTCFTHVCGCGGTRVGC